MIAHTLAAFGLAVAVAAGAGQAPAATSEATNPVEITEWEVPFGGRPRDPFPADPDAVWFVGQRGHYIARFTPSTGEFFRRDLPDDAGPHNLIVGGDGIVWYAGNLAGYIGRYDPDADAFERIDMPNGVRDPHTLVFDADRSHIWFTAQGSNVVGRLTLATRAVDIVPVETPGARPYGIRMGPDGRPWIALLGTNRIATVDPVTLNMTEYEIPEAGARPRRLEVLEDGRVLYVDYARGRLGQFDPVSEAFKDWLLPSGEGARPYGTARDGEGRVWLVETGVSPNQLVAFDAEREAFVSITPIPSGGGAVRHMNVHEPSGTLWFGTDSGTIGAAVVGGD